MGASAMRKCALNNNPACKIPENSLRARPALKCAANNNPSQRDRRSLLHTQLCCQ